MAFLKSHCFDCHDSETQEGKVDLEKLPFRITTIEQAELWQKVLNALNAGEMPPEDSEQPANAEKADFLDGLAQTMVTARRALSDSGGKITMRRLNRREYRNTIEHLLGIKVDVSSLPADGGSGNFDTVGASQFISSDQIEQYLKIGRSAIDELFEWEAALAQESKALRVEPEKTINPANEKEIERIEDEYERFTRWKKGVDEAAKTPANQAKIAEIRKTDRLIDHPVRFYAYADRLEGTPNPKDFGFRDSAKAAGGHPEGDRRNLAYHKHYAALPHRDRGTYLKVAHGTGRVIISPKKLPPGNYTLRVRAGKVEGSPTSRHFIEVGYPQRQIASRNWGLEGRPISSHQVTGTIENPETIEISLEVGSKTPREFAIQEKQPNNGNLKALWDAHNALKKKNGYGHPPAIWIDWIELEGPHNASRPRSWKQRREVEEHANTKVGGTYNGYFKGGHANAKAFLETGKLQKGIADEQEAKFRIRTFEEHGPSYRRYLDDPLTKTGSFLTISNVNKEEFIALPPEHPSGWRKTKHVVEALPPGNYKLRFRIGTVEGTPSERYFVDLGAVPNKDQFKHQATFQITGTTDKPQTIEVPVQLTNDGPRKFALREKRDLKTDNARYQTARKETGVGPDPALWIDWVEWEGPLNASNGDSSRNKWWITDADEPDESSRARKVLEQFAYHAFRGVEAEVEFIDRLTNIFASRRKAGDSFDTAIRLPLSIILASPGFLYLNEPNDADERRQLTDRELAVRMAYFLWSAPPDQELLDLAKQQKLSQPKILRQQVDRLITDSRSDEFVSSFVHQWLHMERLDFFQFDTTLHREFDESTRSAARQEVYHSFAHLLRDPKGGQLGKLLKSDYVFINGLLGTYYGIDGVTGDKFRKVKLPADSPRGGLLGMAAIHAMGSDGIKSSPVERGVWVLRHLLNDPPPPAPPNVPQLSRLEDQVLTKRERILTHQEEAQCASCHRKIDPIGFGLENFDAAGKWRTTDSYRPTVKKGKKAKNGKKRKTWKIDASGAFHKGPAFDDYHELRDLIAERDEDFARGFTEHLIEYALGRPFGFTDEDLANDIVSSAKSKQFALSDFVHSLVQSKAFQTKGRRSNLRADSLPFKSHLFEKGTLVYSDDFDGVLDRKRWGLRTKKWEVKDGKLIGIPSFKNAQEAQKALGRDHHLGLGPVIRFNNLPAKFVCRLRFKFEGEAYKPARPKLDIGHHINSLVFTKEGYSLKLSGDKKFGIIKADSALNQWVDMIIEFEEGKLFIEINRRRKLFEHDQVSMKSRDEFTFKALESPKSRLVFDYVRLWEVK